MELLWLPLWSLMTLAVVFLPLELLLPARRAPAFTWRRYATDLLHATVGQVLIRIGFVFVMALAINGPRGTGPLAELPLWQQVILVFLISDLMFWIAHRLFHAVPWLWQFHKIHHSSEHLDWLAAFRVHPVDQVINSALIAVPVVALGFSPEAVLIFGAIYKWHAILLHSNVAVSLGPLERLIVMPKFHHWHHADVPEAYDRNFGGQLTVWDRLFGTHYAASQDRPPRYGVDDPPAEDFAAHLIFPFLRRAPKWQS